MPYMVTFTINIPQMLPYMAYMDPMGTGVKGKLGYQRTYRIDPNWVICTL